MRLRGQLIFLYKISFIENLDLQKHSKFVRKSTNKVLQNLYLTIVRTYVRTYL
jgi:hypothetical protein